MGDNPLVTFISDGGGDQPLTTTVDLLGRVISATDAWGKTTTSTYDLAGRLTQTSGSVGVQEFGYDPAGRLISHKLDGAVVAVPGYDAAGQLASVSYPSGTGNGGNGTSLSPISRDLAGRTTGLTWNLAGATVADSVTRSQSGKVTAQTAEGRASTFGYDGAGRLTSANVPGHSLTYGFAPSGGCGSAATAGKNTNRTSMVDNAVTTSYCYDAADKVTSTTDARYGAIAYDGHGNTATLGSQTPHLRRLRPPRRQRRRRHHRALRARRRRPHHRAQGQ
ncbi:MAG: RHS repeat protein [Actinomycetota bacterium]|nr:RHS repeat protein [Actinomycetota bacterium]